MKSDIPKDTGRTQSASQNTLLAISLKHKVLRLGLAVVVRVKRDSGVIEPLVNVDNVLLAAVYDSCRRRVYQLGYRMGLASIDDSLCTDDIDLFVDCRAKTVYGRCSVEDYGRVGLFSACPGWEDTHLAERVSNFISIGNIANVERDVATVSYRSVCTHLSKCL